MAREQAEEGVMGWGVVAREAMQTAVVGWVVVMRWAEARA